MDNFYITLPSNSSMNVYPNNSKSNFTTLLSRSIHLNGEYEVALTNISFPSTINVKCGQITIKKLDCVFNKLTDVNSDITIKLEIVNGIHQDKFLFYLYNTLNIYIYIYFL